MQPVSTASAHDARRATVSASALVIRIVLLAPTTTATLLVYVVDARQEIVEGARVRRRLLSDGHHGRHRREASRRRLLDIEAPLILLALVFVVVVAGFSIVVVVVVTDAALVERRRTDAQRAHGRVVEIDARQQSVLGALQQAHGRRAVNLALELHQLLPEARVGIDHRANGFEVQEGVSQRALLALYQVREHHGRRARDAGATVHQHRGAAQTRAINERHRLIERTVQRRVRVVIVRQAQVLKLSVGLKEVAFAATHYDVDAIGQCQERDTDRDSYQEAVL